MIRWDVQRQMLLDELQRVEQALAAAESEHSASVAELKARLEELRARLRQMGPSPSAKMG